MTKPPSPETESPPALSSRDLRRARFFREADRVRDIRRQIVALQAEERAAISRVVAAGYSAADVEALLATDAPGTAHRPPDPSQVDLEDIRDGAPAANGIEEAGFRAGAEGRVRQTAMTGRLRDLWGRGWRRGRAARLALDGAVA